MMEYWVPGQPNKPNPQLTQQVTKQPKPESSDLHTSLFGKD